ncbi:MAG: DUF2306 domain-containing protein [Acidobacteriota bacterium]|nr:DUF2306 domain-containing protein [Acidobacteriota bacterium]
MSLSVLIVSEIPLLRPTDPRHAHLLSVRWLLLPHALAGTLALLSGPIQFSTRVRRRWLRFHRVLGRVYVFSALTAAVMALVVGFPSPLFPGTIVQSGAWIVTTLAALLTARNRHILQHRQWMVRSYAVTFTFILLRVLNPWPAWSNMNESAFTLAICIATLLAVFVPDIAFSWREITHRRA